MIKKFNNWINNIKKRSTPYEDWKNGEKVFKMPWVIRYYENITDFNQYLMGKRVKDIATGVTTVFGFCMGVWMGNIIWG